MSMLKPEPDDLKSRPKSTRRRRAARPAKTATTVSPPPPVAPSPSRAPSAHAASTSSDTHLRFQLATLLRLTDNIVTMAVNAYDRLFALDRKDEAEIYLDVGKTLAEQGKSEQALEALRKASQLRPDDPQAKLQLALLQIERQMPEPAVRALMQLKEAGHASYELHKGLFEALTMQGKEEAALPELEAALSIRPDVAEDHFRLGAALDRTGEYERAVDAFQRAITLAPREIAYHQSLGFTYESMGRRDEAIKCFKRALQLERPSLAPTRARRD